MRAEVRESNQQLLILINRARVVCIDVGLPHSFDPQGLAEAPVRIKLASEFAEEALPKDIESIELKDLSGVADTTSQSVEDVETPLKTINDPQIDLAWVAQTTRDLAGVKAAMRDELANNLAKLIATDDRKSEVEKHLARERRKLTETDDTEIQQDIRDRMKKLQGELSDIELERQARLEALSANKAALCPRSTEFVRPSGGSSMKTRRWLSEFELSSANRG